MRDDAKHPCDSMKKAEIGAFDRVAAGGAPRCSDRTIARLVERGLIERHLVRVASNDHFGPIVKHEYSVPIALHIEWCDWMTRPKTRSKRGASAPAAPGR